MSGITDELRRIIKNTAVADDDYPDSMWVVISQSMALALANEIDIKHEDRIDEYEDRIDLLDAQNAKLRKLVQRMWPVFIGEKRATFADRLHVMAEIDELGIEVDN